MELPTALPGSNLQIKLVQDRTLRPASRTPNFEEKKKDREIHRKPGCHAGGG
jgi:hypothetical protein